MGKPKAYECCAHCHVAGKCGGDGFHPFPCEVPGCDAGTKAKPRESK